MNTENGGPAFPEGEWTGISPESGMTLRDYFAAAALTGELSAQYKDAWEWWPANFHHLAKHCYGIADAMLAERSKEKA